MTLEEYTKLYKEWLRDERIKRLVQQVDGNRKKMERLKAEIEKNEAELQRLTAEKEAQE